LEKPISPRTISFRAGSTSRTDGGQIYNAVQVFIHPDYNSATFDYDVAVVRTLERMVGAHVSPIKLVNSNGVIPPSTLMTVTGWGRTEQGSLPTNLRGVIVPVVTNELCRKQWGGEITYTMMCAGMAGRDACNGDSGGPVIAGDIQFGIVSWGSTTCGSTLPGVYTNITNEEIRSFIVKTTGI
jgi:trypsin